MQLQVYAKSEPITHNRERSTKNHYLLIPSIVNVYAGMITQAWQHAETHEHGLVMKRLAWGDPHGCMAGISCGPRLEPGKRKPRPGGFNPRRLRQRGGIPASPYSLAGRTDGPARSSPEAGRYSPEDGNQPGLNRAGEPVSGAERGIE